MAAPPPTLAAALPQPTLFTLAAAPLIIHAPPTMKAAPPQYPSPTMAAPPPKTNKADRWGRSTRVSDACI
jgi:hypothetical protein